MTPQVQAGISNGDGAFALFGSPPFCTSAIKALTTVGFKGPVTAIEQCVDQTSAKATNGGYKGVNVLTSRNSTNKEYAQYLAVMRKYAKGVDTGGVAPGGYTAVLALVRALPNLTGDVTAQTISAGMAAMPPTPLPLGGGIMFQCNGTQVSLGAADLHDSGAPGQVHGEGDPGGLQGVRHVESPEARLTPPGGETRAAGGPRWISI